MDLRELDIQELDRRALALLGGVVAQLKDDQLRLPTPCPDWTLHGLLRHLVSQNEGFAASARGAGGALSAWRGGDLGDDARAAFEASAALVDAAFAEDGVLTRPFVLPEVRDGGAFPGRVAISFHFVDCVVHAWDVAATIGVPWEPDEELTAAALRVAEQVPDEGRGPGAAFEGRVPPLDDAPPHHRLLGLLGRVPSWAGGPC
ncbi:MULTISPECIES: TIGR03086 family metal-binding protein [unclassified Streptomyces]|uniref:TIGR03086 family metal-binding protein n=1 Tax=unclassified Streptomyces TaxID=2593676 RepID=UPI003369EF95